MTNQRRQTFADIAPNERRFFWRMLFVVFDIPAILFWIYVFLKLFVVDIDVLLFNAALPEYVWLLNYKFLFFLVLIAGTTLLLSWQMALGFFLFVFFYPIILIVWRIPRLILGRQSWTFGIGLINFILGFFRTFRRNVAVASLLAISITTTLVSTERHSLTVAAGVLLLCVLGICVATFLSSFKPPRVYELYKRILPNARKFVIQNGTLDESIKNLPVERWNDKEVQAWASKVQVPLLANRLWLFVALRLREYQTGAAPFIGGVVALVSLFALVVFGFACINFAASKIDSGLYDGSNLSFFNFLWYSFNAILFNFVKEIAPQAVLSQTLWMIEAFCALFLIAIVVALYLSVRSQRSIAELDTAIAAIEREGRAMELFLATEYKIETAEEALAEMERVKAGMLQVILWLTRNLVPWR